MRQSVFLFLFLAAEEAFLFFSGNGAARFGVKLTKQLLLPFGQPCGHRNVYGYNLITPAASVDIRYAAFFKLEFLTGLRAGGNIKFNIAVERGHYKLAAESRLSEADACVEINRVSLASEIGMLFNVHSDLKIARGTSV